MKWTSKWDGGTYDIKPAYGTIEHWKEGRCWNIACGNPIIAVNIGKTGLWKVGYCWVDFELIQCRNKQGYGYHPRGEWRFAVDGKLKDVRKY